MYASTMQSDDVSWRAVTFDLTEQELADCAERAAFCVREKLGEWGMKATPVEEVVKALHRLCRAYHIKAPSKGGYRQMINRMTDAAWWRRSLRLRHRYVELHQIQAGRVSRHGDSFVSTKTLKRHERRKKRNSELLATLDVINQQTGEVIHLEDVVEASQANPANRRKALMARIKGTETYAKSLGHVALFLTITCPSRMHAVHYAGGRNDRYDGTSPRHAQRYLHHVWNTAMRSASHKGYQPYGLRVVEPHHDGCPHWHVLVFIDSEQADGFSSLMRRYALADSPNEPGAAERRFTVERIDQAKGSAVGYVAKYVSKSVDGEGVDSEEETGLDGKHASRRVVAWSSTWSIRQFQFFGLPAITPTREMYRLDGSQMPSEGLRAAHQCSKANDYAGWMQACKAYGLHFKVNYSQKASTRYSDEITKAIEGLSVQADDLAGVLELVTRTEEWRIEPRRSKRQEATQSEGLASPWTRFNNSAPVDFKGVLGDEWMQDLHSGWPPPGGRPHQVQTAQGRGT